MRRCLDDFSGGNIDVACCLLEYCGRYLFRTKHTSAKLTGLMDAMMRISKAKVREINFVCKIKFLMIEKKIWNFFVCHPHAHQKSTFQIKFHDVPKACLIRLECTVV